jgi:hypothetical protein
MAKKNKKKSCKYQKLIKEKLEWAKLEISKGKETIEKLESRLENTKIIVQRLSGAITVLEELIEKKDDNV